MATIKDLTKLFLLLQLDALRAAYIESFDRNTESALRLLVENAMNDIINYIRDRRFEDIDSCAINMMQRESALHRQLIAASEKLKESRACHSVAEADLLIKKKEYLSRCSDALSVDRPNMHSPMCLDAWERDVDSAEDEYRNNITYNILNP